MTDEALLNCWHRALEEEVGFCLQVDPKDRRWFQNSLYRVRQESGDASLESLIIMSPKDPGELWICKKQQEGLNVQ